MELKCHETLYQNKIIQSLNIIMFTLFSRRLQGKHLRGSYNVNKSMFIVLNLTVYFFGFRTNLKPLSVLHVKVLKCTRWLNVWTWKVQTVKQWSAVIDMDSSVLDYSCSKFICIKVYIMYELVVCLQQQLAAYKKCKVIRTVVRWHAAVG